MIDSLDGSTGPFSVMLLVSARMMLFLRESFRSCGSSSSQIYPKVIKEASLMLMSSLVELLHKLGIRSSHSLLGISMLAIADRIFAI